MKQNKSSGGAVVLAVIITAIVIGGGVYWWQSPAQPTPESLDEVQAVGETDPLFELYESVKFQYSFQYPHEWYIRKWATGSAQPEIICLTDEIILDGEANCIVSIAINTLTLEASLREEMSSKEEIQFAGKPATKIAFTNEFGPPLVSILVPFGEYIYVISYDPQDEKQEVVSDILESFTFTL